MWASRLVAEMDATEFEEEETKCVQKLQSERVPPPRLIVTGGGRRLPGMETAAGSKRMRSAIGRSMNAGLPGSLHKKKWSGMASVSFADATVAIEVHYTAVCCVVHLYCHSCVRAWWGPATVAAAGSLLNLEAVTHKEGSSSEGGGDDWEPKRQPRC
ncbi:hypothetical protein NDU88_010118 [Pleurodeles waltl]|uniref:Uncharacterized protein n=1 Tax=Pleurodeles waltl TaxID=8319 RepID=A0AAV7QXA8_PLEWA|nr:hypothetical protein NDU88_010118 [Pleurodeles waltl]